MQRFNSFATLTLLGALAFASSHAAQEPKKADPPAGDQQTIKTKPTKGKPAAAVPFRKQFGLPFGTLDTLGSRIDRARRTGDPVALGHAAGELDLAEQVSGKTASLTSKQLIAEAAELASLRKQNAELQAVLTMSRKITVEQDQLTNLKKSIEEAQTQAAAAKQALQKNQEPTHAPRKVVVNNYTTQYIDVQVNGYLKGQVDPGTTKVITIDQPWNPIVLKGWGDSDESVFGPVLLQGRFDKYTWNINNDDAVPNLP
jgi:hypothetical protein